jgi:hypothetical protein
MAGFTDYLTGFLKEIRPRKMKFSTGKLRLSGDDVEKA